MEPLAFCLIFSYQNSMLMVVASGGIPCHVGKNIYYYCYYLIALIAC